MPFPRKRGVGAATVRKRPSVALGASMAVASTLGVVAEASRVGIASCTDVITTSLHARSAVHAWSLTVDCFFPTNNGFDAKRKPILCLEASTLGDLGSHQYVLEQSSTVKDADMIVYTNPPISSGSFVHLGIDGICLDQADMMYAHMSANFDHASGNGQ